LDNLDYTNEVEIQAPRETVFAALTTLTGLGGWWTPIVSGDGTEGGEVSFGFEGLDEKIRMRVEKATAPSIVTWACLEHTGHPEWLETRIEFEIVERDSSSCTLRLRHRGLIPKLHCYRACERGWDSFVDSLAEYSETGEGTPYR
jgi:uncharacterized protein YndB with AHSA1/START domain